MLVLIQHLLKRCFLHSQTFVTSMWTYHIFLQFIRACDVCQFRLFCMFNAVHIAVVVSLIHSHIFSSIEHVSCVDYKSITQFKHYPRQHGHDGCLPDRRVWTFVAKFRQSPMMMFTRFFMMRIGEATNPGPNQVRLCVTNPTAIFKKVSDLLDFQGQVIMAAETSATSAVQNCAQREFKQAGFYSFWSPPAISKIPTEDGRPSLLEVKHLVPLFLHHSLHERQG